MKQKWVSFFIIILLFVPDILHSKEVSSHRSSSKNAHKRITQSQSYHLQQVASFKIQKNAEKFVRKLRNEGREALIRKGITKDKRAIYRVFVKEFKAPSKDILSQKSLKHEADLEKTTIGEKGVIVKTSTGEPTESTKDALSAGEMKKIASFKIFKDIEDAGNFARQLRKDGYEVAIRSNIEKNNSMVYTVFAEKVAEKSEKNAPSSRISYAATPEKISVEEKTIEKETPPVARKEQSADTFSARNVRSETAVEKKPVERKPVEAEKSITQPGNASKDILPSSENKYKTALVSQAIEDKPIGSVKERPTEAVFGSRGGFIHPFLSITEYYTDNVFYSNDDKKGDFITLISPGIWLTVPHVYEKLLQIDTSNISPGGFSLSRYKPETFKRYQTYLFYNADIERFSKHSSENAVNHKAEGLFQYNLRGGLSIELLDQFITSHDNRGTGISFKLDKFKSNLANLIISYNVSDRFKLRVDYSNFLVNYNASRNNFRDRNDNAFSGYIFYKFQPKTSLFLEYEFLGIQYREDTALNSKEHHYFGGIQWDITAKSKGSIKAGYGVKDFDDPGGENSNDFIMEAQIDHKFTPKTSLVLKASRRTNETNISTSDYVLSNAIELEYLQRITGKITGNIKLAYTNDRYHGDLTIGSETKVLEDNYYTGAFAFQYKFKEWIYLDLGYMYTRRDSNFSDFDYTSNIVFLRITGSL